MRLCLPLGSALIFTEATEIIPFGETNCLSHHGIGGVINSSMNLRTTVITIFTTHCNTHKLCSLPIECIYMFRMTLSINSNNHFVFVMQMQCDYCDKGSKSLDIDEFQASKHRYTNSLTMCGYLRACKAVHTCSDHSRAAFCIWYLSTATRKNRSVPPGKFALPPKCVKGWDTMWHDKGGRVRWRQ